MCIKKWEKILVIAMLVCAVEGMTVACSGQTSGDPAAKEQESDSQAIEEQTSGEQDAEENKADSEQAVSDEKTDASSELEGEELAKSLIGKEVSKDELEQDMGAWTKFETDHPSCDRTMEEGRFFYEGFVVTAKSYNQGKTYTIVAVNN